MHSRRGGESDVMSNTATCTKDTLQYGMMAWTWTLLYSHFYSGRAFAICLEICILVINCFWIKYNSIFE